MTEYWIVYVLCGVIILQFGVIVNTLWNLPIRYVLRRDYDRSRDEILAKLDRLFEKIDSFKGNRVT